MEAIIFSGIQASGKSTFYTQRFFRSHVRISLDLLHTRNKERRSLELCLQLQQPFVIDNTNPTKDERSKYIEPAKARKFQVIGYSFASSLQDSLMRNEGRVGTERVPDIGLRAVAKKMEAMDFGEGFDRLFRVSIQDSGFQVEEVLREV